MPNAVITSPLRRQKNLDSFSAWIVLILTILYILLYPLHQAPIFVVIPMLAAGWFYGLKGGIAASFAAALLDFILINVYQERIAWNHLLAFEQENFFLVGHLFAAAAGVTLGRLRELMENRNRIEAELRASEERFRSLYENATIGIYCTTPDGKILLANPALTHMLGYDSFEELAARNLEQEGYSSEHPRDEFLKKMERDGVIHSYESIWMRKDGSTFYARESATAIRGEQGNTLRYEGTVEDISNYKMAEMNLQEREMRISNILESAADAIITVDKTQRILSFSRSAEKIFGYTAEEIIGQPLDRLLPERFAAVHRRYVEEFSKEGDPVRRMDDRKEILGRRKNGEEFPAEASISKLCSQEKLIFAVFLRDITDRKRAEQELQSHTRFLSLLNEMTHDVITAQNFDEMAADLAADLTTLLEADHCYITRWDALKEQVFPVATNAQLNQPYSQIVFEKGKKNLTTSALVAGKIIVAEDHANSPDTDSELASNFPTVSAMSIPLIYGGRWLGAAIVSFTRSHHFTQAEKERAEQAGNQIALAIWNMQQDLELQRSLREQKTLANIAQALSETESIGLSNVLNLIVRSAKELIPNAEQSVIHLYNDEEQTLTSEAVAGFSDPTGGKKSMRLGEGIAGQVITSGETVNISDVKTDPRFVKLGTEPSYRSLMVAPVHSGKQILGTISIQSSIPHAFTPNDDKLISQFGTQAAIAIENANLLEKTKQALKEANALYRVNRGLIASLEPDDLLQDTVELLQQNFGYYYVQIFVADPDTGNFAIRAGSGEIGWRLKELGHQLAPGEGIVGYTAETGTPFFTNNVDDAVFYVRHPLLPDTRSELAVPVKVGNEILGLLDIHQAAPKYLSERDEQLVSAVADQLAIALQRADIYENLQISLQQEKAIRSQMMQNERLTVMGRLLATVAHELNNPLQAIQNALFLLREEQGISPQGKQDLEIVLAESERMGNLIERLRATYRPTMSEDFHLTQINHIVEDVRALIATHMRHNQINFEFHPDPELPRIPALSDQIRQVTLNLFMNACEAMTSGGKLRVRTQFLEETDEVMLEVADTGSGIPANMVNTIFEAFITNKPSGTGLGLTISQDIVLKHHGRIAAANNPDCGATFTVWLPVKNGEIE